jgi:hypothetical protein
MLTDLNSLGTPALLVSLAGITKFNLLSTNANNVTGAGSAYYIFCVDATNSYIYNAGGTVTYTITSKLWQNMFSIDGYWWAADSTGLYKFTGQTFTVATAAVSLTSLGYSINTADSDTVSIYVTPTATNQIRKLVLGTSYTSTVAGDIVVTDTLMVEDRVNSAASNWDVYAGYISYQQIDGTWTNISTQEDTVISYPNNLVTELISFQAGIDFQAKQHADTAGLEKRYQSLFMRYKDSLKRDDYQVERISNGYAQTNNIFFSR